MTINNDLCRVLQVGRVAQSLEEPAETHSRDVAAATLIFSVE